MIPFINNFIDLFIASAPWLLLGLLIAGLMQWLVPLDYLKKQLGQNNLSSIIKAALIGAPIPLCSCGVIPAAIGLRRSGASKSATVSFLVATPETGVDSVSVSYALLGPFMAIIRPIFAIISAIYAGLMVKLAESISKQKSAKNNEATFLEHSTSNNKSCCAKSSSIEQPTVIEKTKNCCHAERELPTKVTVLQRIGDAIQFASGKLLKDITLWLLIGLIVAAVIKTWVPEAFLTQWGDGLIAMLVMALIGIPMYICATASTPMAAGFLAAGVSPGAVLVFMLAGPATNLSTMGMIRQELGKPVLIAYLFSILTASVSLGYLTNLMVSQFQFEVYTIAAHSHEMSDSFIYQSAAVLLSLLIMRNWLRHSWPKFLRNFSSRFAKISFFQEKRR